MRSLRLPAALVASVVALVVTTALLLRVKGGLWPGAPVFTAISDDDFARITIAQALVQRPRLDPSGTSWLPFPFWMQGAVFAVFGRSLQVAYATAIVSSGLATALLLWTARLLGCSPTRASGLVALCFLFPVAPFLAAATVPEVPTAALAVFGVVASCTPTAPRWCRGLGLLSLSAATLSRYETWPMAAVVAGVVLWRAARSRRTPRGDDFAQAGHAALALAGPAAWMAWSLFAHGDALWFFHRVAAFRAHHVETTGIFAAYPLTFLRHGAAGLLLAAVATWSSMRRARQGDGPADSDAAHALLVAAAASFAFLVAGDWIGGAPTHHPERALLPVWVGLVLACGVRLPSPLKWQTSMALGAAALVVFGAQTSPLTTSFADRRSEIEEGRALRKLVPPGERVVVVRDSYASEATRAAFERAEDLDPVMSTAFDRRSTETPLASAEALRASLQRHRARFFVLEGGAASLGPEVGELVSELPTTISGHGGASLYVMTNTPSPSPSAP